MDNLSATGPLDLPLLRRLATLKLWVDANGAHAGDTYWKPGHDGPPFEPDHWLRDRSDNEFDAGDVGALAVPTPTASALREALRTRFQFLADLDAEERTVALAREQDRPLVLRVLTELPGGRLAGRGLY